MFDTQRPDRVRQIEDAKSVLKRMAEGRILFGPAYFDRVMAEFGLTPEDIGI